MTKPKYAAAVGAHVCLDIRPPNPEKAKEILEATCPGITKNPRGNLTYIPNPIPSELEDDMARLIAEAEKQPQGVATGGTVSNAGIPLSFLLGESNVALMTSVGNDPVGEKIKEIVTSHHKGPLHIKKSDKPSSYTFIVKPEGEESHYYHCPGANDDYRQSDLEWDLINRSGFFIFGYPPLMRQWYESLDVLGNVFRDVKEKGKRTYLDMHRMEKGTSDRWKRILENALPYVDVFNPTLEEALFVMDPELLQRLEDMVDEEKQAGNLEFDVMDAMDGDAENILRGLGNYYIKMGGHAVIIKCGKYGAYIRADEGNPKGWNRCEAFVPAYVPKKVEDTTGAGDNVMAAVAASDYRGASALMSLLKGVGAGLRNVEYPGSVGAFRSFDDLIIQDREMIQPPFESSLIFWG